MTMSDPEYYALIKAQFIENGHDCVATKMNDVFADVCNAAGIDKTKRRGYYGWLREHCQTLLLQVCRYSKTTNALRTFHTHAGGAATV